MRYCLFSIFFLLFLQNAFMVKRIFGIAFYVFACVVLNAQVKFLDQPAWKDVLAKAEAEHKFIFVDGYTTWCHWCKIMDKTTFKNAVVGDYMNKNFVCAKMDMERGFGCNLTMKFGVMSFPTYIVLSPEGKYVDCLYGFFDSVNIVKELTRLKTMPEAEYPTGISTQIDLPFPDFYRKRFVIDSSGHRYYPDSATNAAYLAGQKDLMNEVTWNVLRLSGAALKPYAGWILANEKQITRLFGRWEAATMLEYAVNFKFLEVSARGDEAAFQNEILPLIERYMSDSKALDKPFFKMRFYHAQKNYEKYLLAIKEFNELVKAGEGNPDLINMSCWDLCQECDDERILREAAAIMKEFTATRKDWSVVTYASLLYKLKDYKQVEAVCNKAIELGLPDKDDVASLKKLLDKVNAAKGH